MPARCRVTSRPRLVLLIGPAQRLHVELVVERIDERSDEAALVEQMDGLRRGEDEVSVPRIQLVGRQELDEEDRGVADGEKGEADDGDLVPQKPPPDQPCLRGLGVGVMAIAGESEPLSTLMSRYVNR